MDAMTLSTTFATIVGLICNYRQEKGASETLNHANFMEWLEYHRHTELKNLISNTYHLQSEVDALLKENQVTMIAKLNAIEQTLALLLSQVGGFAPIARAVHPQLEFSEHAQWIIGRFAATGADRMGLLPNTGGPIIHFISKSGPLKHGHRPTPENARFLPDDLRTLCNAGLLLSEYASRGEMYRLTRAGYAFAKNFGLLEKHRAEIDQEKDQPGESI